MTYREYLEKIKMICNQFVGTKNMMAYRDITNKIDDINEDMDLCLEVEYGYCRCNTEFDADNYYERFNYIIFSYEVHFECDKRYAVGHNDLIENVEVINELPAEFLDLDMSEMERHIACIAAREKRHALIKERAVTYDKMFKIEKDIAGYDEVIRRLGK